MGPMTTMTEKLCSCRLVSRASNFSGLLFHPRQQLALYPPDSDPLSSDLLLRLAEGPNARNFPHNLIRLKTARRPNDVTYVLYKT